MTKNYLNEDYTLRSWLFTTDHKRIALLYLFSITLFFLVGAIGAGAVRLNLLSPQGLFLSAPTYNRMFTMHGVIMVWFFLVPSIPVVFGNFFLPMMVGAKDLAFPRINLLSWYVFMIGGLVCIYGLLKGGVDTGWTFYTPFSSLFSNGYVVTVLTGVFITGFSTIMTGINLIVTTHKMRAPGLTWYRLPLFVWSIYATSIILVLATPVLAMTLALVAVEHLWHIGIFDPSLGGDPLLFQNFFWFYSHPAVYIMVLPAMGVVSEILPVFARKNIFNYKVIAYSSLAIAVIGFLVWGHHMFVSGQSAFSSLAFSFLSYCVAVPSAIKVFNWTATLYKGSISLKAPMLYALGFVGLFTVGGLSGLFLAALAIDVHVHDTYFVIAHFHYIMVGGSVMAYIGAAHYWWPKITGKMYPEKLAQWAAILIFVGFNVTFLPQFVLGYLGMPRRYHHYPPQWQLLNVVSTCGTLFLAVGYFMPLIYFAWAYKHAEAAPSNPWGALTLEWQTPSPPPKHNFEQIPIVTRQPYDFPAPGETPVLRPV